VKRIAFLFGLLTLVAGEPALALRGVTPGTACALVTQVEAHRGSVLIKTLRPDEDGTYRILFRGDHYGHPASVLYHCKSDVVSGQTITLQFDDRDKARVVFEVTEGQLRESLGAPDRDDNKEVLAGSQLGLKAFGLTAQTDRFLAWYSDDGTVAMILSGEAEEWSIGITGF
jgi:hypothetical protein